MRRLHTTFNRHFALYIGRLVIDSLPLSSLKRSPILNRLLKGDIVTKRGVVERTSLE